MDTLFDLHPPVPEGFIYMPGISLLRDCTFKLRLYDKQKQTRAAVRSLMVNRRSLYVIGGQARAEREQSISPVKSLRYSITFRTLRQPVELSG